MNLKSKTTYKGMNERFRHGLFAEKTIDTTKKNESRINEKMWFFYYLPLTLKVVFIRKVLKNVNF